MNELTAKLLKEALHSLPAKKRTPERLECELGSLWVVWRNHLIEDWIEAVLPQVQRRPASNYYPGTDLGEACLDWLGNHGFYTWETPVFDGEDDDFVYHFVAHWLGVMTWDVFEDMWPHLDHTPEDLARLFEYQNTTQLNLF